MRGMRPVDSAGRNAVALQGTIDSFALADVMRLLGSSSKTGRLIVNGDRGSANLWFDGGRLVGGGSSTQPGDLELPEVVFDILRYTTGSFIFEADAACPDPLPGESVDEVIVVAEGALAEWSEIIQVVPSLESWLRLAPELQYPEVVVDQACWTAIVAVGGGCTVRQLGEQLRLGELPSCRLVRALVGAGFVEVAEAPVAEPAPPTELVELPTRHPATEPVVDHPVDAFGLDDAVEQVDEPFGGWPEDGVALPSLTIAGLTDDPFADHPDEPGNSEVAWPPTFVEPPVEQHDVQRSMSTLSEKAAQALASVANGQQDEREDARIDDEVATDEERERMLRFLGSV
jgi:hypothetical protein